MRTYGIHLRGIPNTQDGYHWYEFKNCCFELWIWTVRPFPEIVRWKLWSFSRILAGEFWLAEYNALEKMQSYTPPPPPSWFHHQKQDTSKIKFELFRRSDGLISYHAPLFLSLLIAIELSIFKDEKDGLVQDCCISSSYTIEILKSGTKHGTNQHVKVHSHWRMRACRSALRVPHCGPAPNVHTWIKRECSHWCVRIAGPHAEKTLPSAMR